MGGKRLLILTASLFTATLMGCGSSMDSGGDQTAAGGGGITAQAVGMDVCTGVCHSTISSQQTLAWLNGPHSNAVNSPMDLNSPGVPSYADFTDSTCATCHDPQGDGANLIPGAGGAGSNATGNVARPTVGCEACHGGGSEHYGLGAIPYPLPDAERCGQCHNNSFNHLTGTDGTDAGARPESASILENYQASPHATGDVRKSAKCVKCHSDEGGRKYKNITTNESLIHAALALDEASAIQCRTCHDGHNPGTLLKGNDSLASAEYNTCTNCHQAHDATVLTGAQAAADTSTSDGANGELIYHGKRWNRIITTTHYDDPATASQIEGYAMDPKNERVCRDCHNVHAADVTINEQWASSAHGGLLFEIKAATAIASGQPNYRTLTDVAQVKAAFTNDSKGAPAWTHYDWDASNRQSCQRCHTATGAKNYLSNPATYNQANNNFSHLAGWWKNDSSGAITSSGQNEMLYCWACHADNSGTLRTPGAITADYETADGLSATTPFPDVKGSNICISCHSGRESGGSIKASTGNFSNLSFINSHYLSAGGTVFTTTGYAYTGRSYTNPDSYEHDQLGRGTTGIAAIDDNYTNGPCVTCHFDSSDGSHTLSPITEYAAGDVGLNPVCVNCHTTRGAGSNAAVVWLNDTWKARYQDALASLEKQLALKGYHFYEAHPYFYQGANGTGGAVKNWLSAGDTDTTGNTTGKNNMGAAFNYNVLAHDPGGVAHNRYYTRRLIYDGIDWIDDNNLNYSVFATLNALNDSVETYKANAITYLINRGTGDVNVGTATERY